MRLPVLLSAGTAPSLNTWNAIIFPGCKLAALIAKVNVLNLFGANPPPNVAEETDSVAVPFIKSNEVFDVLIIKCDSDSTTTQDYIFYFHRFISKN